MTTYMGLSDTDAVLWFENLCLVQLNRNPTETTKQLEAFRETEQGLTVAIHILKTSNTTYDASPNKFILQFHALSIAHYTLLLRWERFVSEDKLQWKSFLFEYLQQIISSSTTPHYLIQKVIQVYVSIWKKDWLSLNAQEKDSFFRPFLVGLNPTNQYHLQKSSMIFILMTIDEFQRKTAFDLSIFYHDMIMIKRDFQEHYLPRIFFLVMSQLSQLFGYLVDISAVADAGELLIISLKAINEIIQWDFHENISKFTDTQTERQVCIGKLPSDYLALVEPSFIGRVLDILHKLVNVRSNNDLVSNKSNMFEELLQELRNLSLALSLLHPDMFPNDSCKSNFVVEIVKGSLFIGNLFLKRSTLQLLTVEANDYTEGGTRSAALTFVLQIFRNVISNHSLMQLIPISHSNPLLAGVLADIFVFIFLSLEGVCQEVSILTNDVNIRLLRSNFKDVSMEMNLLSTWRIDVLISILDLLEVVANAFYEFSSEKNLIALLHTLTIDNASSLTTLLADKIQVDLYRSKLDVFSLMTAYLAPIIYPTLCECVATIFVNDSLSCAEDEENEEDADIGGHIIQSLLSGCGILGRFNIGYALNNLSRMVEGSVKDMRDLDAIMSVNGSTQSEIFQLKEIYCLEKTRVTLLFACHLLADDFASELSDSETRMEAQVTSIMKTGKDAPTINFWILYGFESSVHEASCLNSFQFLNECIQRFNALLQYQLEILSRSQGSSGIMASPLLLQTTLNFFGSFLEKFMDPNTELYSTETLSAITFLSSDRLRGNTKFSILSAEHELIVLSCIKFSLGDVFNTFLETILATLFCLLDRLPYESGAIRASCECIVTATKSVNPLRSIFISRHQSLQSILVKYFTTSSQEQMMGANISFDAFASLTESIVVALLGGHSTDVFTQVLNLFFFVVWNKRIYTLLFRLYLFFGFFFSCVITYSIH